MPVTRVMCLTDWHVGLNYMDDPYVPRAYCPTTKRRLRKLLQNFAEFENDEPPEELYVWLGGDLIHGLIHPVSDRWRISGNLNIQLSTARQLLQEFVDQLDFRQNCTGIIITPGNHSRFGTQREIADLSPTIEDCLCTPFSHHPTHYHPIRTVVKTKAGLLGFQHGHQFKAGAPLTILDRLRKNRDASPSDFDFLGHFHTQMLFADVLFAPSAAPFDSVAAGLGSRMEKPAQTICDFTEDGVRLHRIEL